MLALVGGQLVELRWPDAAEAGADVNKVGNHLVDLKVSRNMGLRPLPSKASWRPSKFQRTQNTDCRKKVPRDQPVEGVQDDL
ncbi:MAG: hypothetical protein OXH68_17855 [Gammaproteobacteria bacterium]|nr:hypothetical protein [Gammaproteobacteria bacterium]